TPRIAGQPAEAPYGQGWCVPTSRKRGARIASVLESSAAVSLPNIRIRSCCGEATAAARQARRGSWPEKPSECLAGAAPGRQRCRTWPERSGRQLLARLDMGAECLSNGGSERSWIRL